MKENKPKVKDSHKYWDGSYMTPNGSYFFDKATYDRLVSLEAKIEELKELIKVYQYPSMAKDLPDWTTNNMHLRLANRESELAELVKKHSLY